MTGRIKKRPAGITRKKIAGFTLIEVILAGAITGGVILATVSIYVFQEVQLKTTMSRVDLSREAYLAMVTVRDTVRYLTKTEFFNGGPLFYQDEDRLMRRDPTADQQVLIRVQPGGFVVTPNADSSYINIELHLIDRYDQVAHYYTIIRFKPE